MAKGGKAYPPIQIGRVIGQTFGAIRANAFSYLLVVIVFGIVPSAALYLLPATVWSHLGSNRVLISYGVALLRGTLTLPIYAATVFGALAYMRGEPFPILEALHTGLRYWWPMLLISTVRSVILLIGTALLIVPGVILFLMLIVASPAKLVEKLSVLSALTRSVKLTRGRRWAIAGIMAIYLAGLGVVYVASLLAANLFQGFLISHGVAGIQVASEAMEIVGFVVAPAWGAALYIELRETREGQFATPIADVFA